MGSEAVEEAPDDFASLVAMEPRRPRWLDLIIARVLADASDHGVRVPAGWLKALPPGEDPWLAAWLAYAESFQPKAGNDPTERLARLQAAAGPGSEVAHLLESARVDVEPRRSEILRVAFLRSRAEHPDVKDLWNGWTEIDGRLTPISTP